MPYNPDHFGKLIEFVASVLSNPTWLLIGFFLWRIDIYYRSVFSRNLTKGVDWIIDRMERHIWSSLRSPIAIIFVGLRLGWWCLRCWELLLRGFRALVASLSRISIVPRIPKEMEAGERFRMGLESAPSATREMQTSLRRRQRNLSGSCLV